MPRRLLSGAVCGLVTATWIVVIIALLADYQVVDYNDRDGAKGLAGSFLAVLCTVLLFAVLGRTGDASRLDRANWHALAALILIPVAVLPLTLGGERGRLEAAVLWGAAAVATHLLIAYGGWARWFVALPLVLAVAVTVTAQPRWRAQKFEAVGLPLVVPQVPGFRLTGTWAGHAIVAMTLENPSGRVLYAIIEGPHSDHGTCHSATPRSRLVRGDERWPEHAVFCVGDSAVLVLQPAEGATTGVADLLPGTTLRAVDASVLAAQPDDSSMAEPD